MHHEHQIAYIFLCVSQLTPDLIIATNTITKEQQQKQQTKEKVSERYLHFYFFLMLRRLTCFTRFHSLNRQVPMLTIYCIFAKLALKIIILCILTVFFAYPMYTSKVIIIFMSMRIMQLCRNNINWRHAYHFKKVSKVILSDLRFDSLALKCP